jgi:glucosyl-dolichyl phosphate glucuronosyltransferase
VSEPRLTVAICTRDREARLRQLLQSLFTAPPPARTTWEVLVVDNGTGKGTAALVESLRSQLPLRLVRELTPGLARARNAAVAHARGEYIVWTDDDCVVDRGWLPAYVDAFTRWPDAALFGGPIVPQFQGTAPRWFPRVRPRVAEAYAARDLGPVAVRLTVDGNLVPFGANYAVRAKEQRENPYPEHLGRGSDLMTVGEESEVLEDMLRHGALGWWIPDARVTHCIDPERQTLRYLREYYTAYGAYAAWRHENHGTTDADAGSGVMYAQLRYLALRVLRPPEQWIQALITASMARGRARASRRGR